MTVSLPTVEEEPGTAPWRYGKQQGDRNRTITPTHFHTQRVYPQEVQPLLVGRVVAVSKGSGAKPRFRSQPHYSLPVCPRATDLTLYPSVSSSVNWEQSSYYLLGAVRPWHKGIA